MSPVAFPSRSAVAVMLVAAATAVPVALASTFPSQDGPSHLYNAWVAGHDGWR